MQKTRKYNEIILRPAKRENFHKEKRHGHADHRRGEIAHDGREAHDVVDDDDDDVLYDVVRYIRYGKF